MISEIDVESARGHWSIGTNLHEGLEVMLREGVARRHGGNGPLNMALVRHAAVTLHAPATRLNNRCKRTGLDTIYLGTAITAAPHDALAMRGAPTICRMTICRVDLVRYCPYVNCVSRIIHGYIAWDQRTFSAI